MADFLAKPKRIHAEVDVGYDVVQDNGQKLEFGGTRVITIQRPNKFRFEARRRDGSHTILLFDGKHINFHDPNLKVYAAEKRKGNYEQTLDYLSEKLETPIPLGELFSTRLRSLLTEPDRVRAVRYVEVSTIDGVPCDQVAGRGKQVDFQAWIPRSGDPLPRRIVIGYRDEPGQPQFWANFRKWDLNPETPDSLFAFKPDKGVRKINIMTRPVAAVK
jgi:hypothetical protein